MSEKCHNNINNKDNNNNFDHSLACSPTDGGKNALQVTN